MAAVLTNNAPAKHIDKDELPKWIMPERTRILSTVTTSFSSPTSQTGAVFYWMQRDMRTVDNWALLLAKHYAETSGLPLRVMYVMPPPPSTAASASGNLPPKVDDLPHYERHGKFLIGGMEQVHKELEEEKVPLHIVVPESRDAVGPAIDKIAADYKAKCIVCDFSPLRHFRQWNELQTVPLLDKRKIPFFQVDAHNVVPCWLASPKREVGARTLRSKINKLVHDFMDDFPAFAGNDHLSQEQVDKLQLDPFDRPAYERYLQLDDSVPECDWAAEPGFKGGMKKYQFFVEKGGLKQFADKRNDPTLPNICSDLSPWLNYGHVGFQTILMKVKKINKYATGTASFVEEGLIRKELSDNYVYYTPHEYDSLDAAAGWAKETLETHTADEREYLYTLQEFEEGRTHDALWNAAQLQVVREGRMHGFMRMYWAKKILEWTETPEIALRTAQYFNDKYALDGRDPNGFVGVSWSIFGLHDQGWKEREVFGKIRFMNFNGCKRKFKVDTFIGMYKGAAKNALEAEKTHGKAEEPAKKKAKAPANKKAKEPANKKRKTRA
ncbi:Deoxyribodipyrimidine photo-lyase [Seminavis robusta]|uniref:Deoxyribodipyrimidine photo-lyase n=1 Tax=Seminavis robusta TaxID=568900 RepID=A0A9N8E2U2_9STRA|nr:Deoxyribodipyrimidine photo-lyase [Seminavis robusta]|eukprot:Sro592_g172190.1 Deoxyribodipyrimidine photo-lyase (553) ;mRNA; f:49133-51061